MLLSMLSMDMSLVAGRVPGDQLQDTKTQTHANSNNVSHM